MSITVVMTHEYKHVAVNTYNTSKSVSTSRTHVLVLLVLPLISNENALFKACALA